MYVSDHEYVVNLDPLVKTLILGARIDIHDAVYMRTWWRSMVLVSIMKSSMVLEEVTLKQSLCNMYLLIWTSI